jgi:hypothetical protein
MAEMVPNFFLAVFRQVGGDEHKLEPVSHSPEVLSSDNQDPSAQDEWE